MINKKIICLLIGMSILGGLNLKSIRVQASEAEKKQEESVNSKVEEKQNVKVKIETYGNFIFMSKIGLNRGNYQGRKPLGFILPENIKLEIRQRNNNYKNDLILDLLNDDSTKEKRYIIPKDGSWISVENINKSVPFIKKVMGSVNPEIEYRINNKNKLILPIYNEFDDEKKFFKLWYESDAEFAFIENDKIQMLIPKKDRENLKKMKDFKNIDELFQFYNELIKKYDYFMGLSKKTDNLIDKNIDTQHFIKANKNGYGYGYYTLDHIGQNSDSIEGYLSRGWLPLHEIGHGYEYNIKNKGINLIDVFNNILGHFYQRTFRDGDEGWLFGESGNRDNVDFSMKKIREDGSYASAGYREQLGVFTYLIEFIGEEKFAEFNKLYREKDLKNQLLNKNIGMILRELLSEITDYDFIKYFDSYKIPNNSSLYLEDEKYLKNKNVFILADIIKDLEKAEEIKKEKNLKSIYSLISTEEIMKSKVNLRKGVLTINIDNLNDINGKTVYLRDGNKIIDKIILNKYKKNEFKNIIPGRYKINISTNNKISEIKNIDIYSGNNSVDLKAPYMIEGIPLFNQSIKLKGLGDFNFAEIITDLKENKINIKINKGKPHIYFNDTYAKIQLINQDNKIIYDKEFRGDKWENASTQTLNIKLGDKIKIFHREPDRLQIFDLDLIDLNKFKYLNYKFNNNTEFIISNKGLEGGNINNDKRLYNIIDKYGENLKKKLGISIKEYEFFNNYRYILNNAIKILPNYVQEKMLKQYGDLINKKENENITVNKIKPSIIELSKYISKNNEMVYDQVIEVPFMLEETKKIFEIRDKNGNLIYKGDVATFANKYYPQYKPGSVIQVIIPKKYNNSNYTLNILIKDLKNNKVSKFNIPIKENENVSVNENQTMLL